MAANLPQSPCCQPRPLERQSKIFQAEPKSSAECWVSCLPLPDKVRTQQEFGRHRWEIHAPGKLTWASKLNWAWGRVTGVGEAREPERRQVVGLPRPKPVLASAASSKWAPSAAPQRRLPSSGLFVPSGRVTLGDVVQSVKTPHTLPRRPEDSLRPTGGRVSTCLSSHSYPCPRAGLSHSGPAKTSLAQQEPQSGSGAGSPSGPLRAPETHARWHLWRLLCAPRRERAGGRL